MFVHGGYGRRGEEGGGGEEGIKTVGEKNIYRNNIGRIWGPHWYLRPATSAPLWVLSVCPLFPQRLRRLFAGLVALGFLSLPSIRLTWVWRRWNHHSVPSGSGFASTGLYRSGHAGHFWAGKVTCQLTGWGLPWSIRRARWTHSASPHLIKCKPLKATECLVSLFISVRWYKGRLSTCMLGELMSSFHEIARWG